MNLYLVKRTDSVGYDEYDSAVVAALDEESAKEEATELWWNDAPVTVKHVGFSDVKEPYVVLGSFNAG